ncbi:POTRA domain-containing protein [uncultured Gammaproteobacteria bacterium]
MDTAYFFSRILPAALTSAWLALSMPAFAAPSANTQPPPTVPVQPATETANIQGFRSAKFGMAEAQVRQAITSDFKTLAEEITKQKNDVEQTTALSFDADNVLPVGGKAKVTYILGYQTQKLIQVNLTWSLGSGMAASSEALVETANLLRQHFLKKTYKPGSVLTNAQIPDGSVIVFRGNDAEGRMTILVLGGEKQPVMGKDAPPDNEADEPTSVLYQRR